jgi:hypothetical protein
MKSDNQNDKNTIWYRKQGELIFKKIAVKYTRFCFDDRRRKDTKRLIYGCEKVDFNL